MIIRRLMRAAVGSAAAVGLGITVLAAPAGAVLIQEDEVLIVGTDVDFGSIAIDPGPFQNGIWQPGGFGELLWDDVNGAKTPRLTGYLWTQNLAGTCAKMRMRFYDEVAPNTYAHLATRGSPPKCPNANTTEWTAIDMAPYTDSRIARVVVSTTVENAGGQFVDIGSQAFNL